jgi:DNA-binding NarL/FixJ family response regulator
MKRVYLADDHPMLREGMIHLVQEKAGCEVCGQASNAAEAVEDIPKLMPDLVILDLSLPDKSGLEVIKDLQTLAPGVPVLVFSMHDELLYAERVIRAGGKGFLIKGSSSAELVEAIKIVLAGGIYLSTKVSAHILKGLSGPRRRDQRSRLERLSDRELEVFGLIGSGKSTSQIALQLNISPRTVDAHRCHIRAKLGLPDSPSLVREAVLWVELKGEAAPAEAPTSEPLANVEALL